MKPPWHSTPGCLRLKACLILKSAKVTQQVQYHHGQGNLQEADICGPGTQMPLSFLWYCFEFLWWAKWCGCPCHGCLFGFTCCMINQCFIPWRTWYFNICVNCWALFHLAEMDYRKDCWQVSRWLCQGSKRSVTYRVCSCVTKSHVCYFIYCFLFLNIEVVLLMVEWFYDMGLFFVHKLIENSTENL